MMLRATRRRQDGTSQSKVKDKVIGEEASSLMRSSTLNLNSPGVGCIKVEGNHTVRKTLSLANRSLLQKVLSALAQWWPPDLRPHYDPLQF